MCRLAGPLLCTCWGISGGVVDLYIELISWLVVLWRGLAYQDPLSEQTCSPECMQKAREMYCSNALGSFYTWRRSGDPAQLIWWASIQFSEQQPLGTIWLTEQCAFLNWVGRGLNSLSLLAYLLSDLSLSEGKGCLCAFWFVSSRRGGVPTCSGVWWNFPTALNWSLQTKQSFLISCLLMGYLPLPCIYYILL